MFLVKQNEYIKFAKNKSNDNNKEKKKKNNNSRN